MEDRICYTIKCYTSWSVEADIVGLRTHPFSLVKRCAHDYPSEPTAQPKWMPYQFIDLPFWTFLPFPDTLDSENGVNYHFGPDAGGNSYGNAALTFSEDDAEFAPKRVKPTRVSSVAKFI